MTVSGVLSGLLDAHGVGFALSRAASAARALETHGAQPTEPTRDIRGHRVDESRFDTADTVELSASAAAEQPQDGPAVRELSAEEQVQLDELEERDREVRAHEQAHLAAAGAYAQGGATFEYQTGPDGRRYAIGGEVSIDTTPIEGDPAATIAKMEQVRAAALAPGQPSAQDLAVAAKAAAAVQEARLARVSREALEESGEADGAARLPATLVDTYA